MVPKTWTASDATAGSSWSTAAVAAAVTVAADGGAGDAGSHSVS